MWLWGNWKIAPRSIQTKYAWHLSCLAWILRTTGGLSPVKWNYTHFGQWLETSGCFKSEEIQNENGHQLRRNKKKHALTLWRSAGHEGTEHEGITNWVFTCFCSAKLCCKMSIAMQLCHCGLRQVPLQLLPSNHISLSAWHLGGARIRASSSNVVSKHSVGTNQNISKSVFHQNWSALDPDVSLSPTGRKVCDRLQWCPQCEQSHRGVSGKFVSADLNSLQESNTKVHRFRKAQQLEFDHLASCIFMHPACDKSHLSTGLYRSSLQPFWLGKHRICHIFICKMREAWNAGWTCVHKSSMQAVEVRYSCHSLCTISHA